jgi:hypothetical protein
MFFSKARFCRFDELLKSSVETGHLTEQRVRTVHPGRMDEQWEAQGRYERLYGDGFVSSG